ncbi:transglycosylase SLT domain-containing protein [Streptomyces glomeratus]|uniref:Transglycosylase SLT domain-containing protein n=1 Tax=Streptomyces glomeratus TaxID=284452 RepID=A0ABP6LSV9_9ACTN|nr:transglycosylase SLT domain-containing protein [Streptomyces glomeratus]MCF1511279.1 transglycosylase SLT domain-containing protein [Streptomyces glomeratus]
MPAFALPACRRDRGSKAARLTRALALAGSGAAVLALPVMGATSASAATGSPAMATAARVAAAKTLTTRGATLDSWIRQSLEVMAQHGIPGTYNGIYRNVMRESSGNPKAINLWDSNARKGIPSKGLLQIIDPTFAAYHVPGTAFDPYDPVANITAACNYAAHRYGSIDNVNSAY